MATCGSLRQIFDDPMPESTSMIDSLSSRSQIKALKPVEASSFTEIFGELHFQEKPAPPSNSPPQMPSSLDRSRPLDPQPGSKPTSNGCSFSPKNSESLQLCTEGLGFESSADVDDLVDSGGDWANGAKAIGGRRLNGCNGYLSNCSDVRLKRGGGGFPPPITCIARSGVCFKSYRKDGRFVLREIRVPTQEFLHASREDGRLKLHFVHPRDDIEQQEEEGEEEEERQEGKREVNEGIVGGDGDHL